MRLSSITIRNFKRLKEVTIKIPKTDDGRHGSADFVTILGQNNVGKSSVIEALRLALPGSDVPKVLIDHFPNREVTNGPVEVDLEFDTLSDEDLKEQGVRTHVHNGCYRVKKSWSAVGVRPELWAYEPTTTIDGWSDVATVAELRATSTQWSDMLDQFEATGEQLKNKPTKAQRDALRNYIIAANGPLLVQGPASWQKNPGGFSSHVDSVLPKLIFVPAVRETKDEAGVSEKKSAARQIVEAMFSKRLAEHDAVKAFTKAGEAVKELFSTGHAVVQEVEQRITAKLERLIPLAAKLNFDFPDVTADLASKTFLEVIDGTIITSPEHQGHGAQRALILSLLELLAEDTLRDQEDTQKFRPILLLIEEPEIYLHPHMERKMRDVLLRIARSGTAQVICTSHSPIFIDLADRHDGIVFVDRDGASAVVRQRIEDLFGGPNADDQRRRLRMLLDFDPAANEAFFTSDVCLVEGDCEVASLDAIAQRLADLGLLDWERFLTSRRNVTVINCRGKWTIAAFQRVLNGFGIPYRVVHDKDAEGEDGANARILSELTGDESKRLVHDPNFERQIFKEEWTRDKPWKAASKIAALAPISDDLVKFFTFVIGQGLEALTPAVAEAAPITEEDTGKAIA